jgi:hypothetical protein
VIFGPKLLVDKTNATHSLEVRLAAIERAFANVGPSASANASAEHAIALERHAVAVTKLADSIQKHAAAVDDHGAAIVAAAVESQANLSGQAASVVPISPATIVPAAAAAAVAPVVHIG